MAKLITCLDVRRWVEEGKVPLNSLTRLPVVCLTCSERSKLGDCLVSPSRYVAWGFRNFGRAVFINDMPFGKFLRCPKCGSRQIAIKKRDTPKYLAKLL
jgi:DNA-directed RNA polymerase subunit RPC12/RpoP